MVMCFLGLLLFGLTGYGNMLFYASFDHSLDADFTVADPRGKKARGATGLFPTATGRGTEWGRSLDAGVDQTGKSLMYTGRGTIDPNRGTIEFFARVDAFGTNWQEHRFFVFGDTSYGKVIALGLHPQEKYLIGTWKFNEKSGWFHARQIITPKKWHHYAMTWDMTPDKGKGEIAIYIDGKRYVHATGLSGFDALPGDFHVACGPKGVHPLLGQLDDLAIFNEVRYTEDFTPRTHPLTAEAANAAKNLIAENIEQARAALADGSNAPIVTNGGFEKWADGKPVGWKLNEGHFAADTAMKVAGGHSLRMATDPMQKARWLNTRIRQSVTLKPHAEYTLRFWAAKDGTGSLRASLRAVSQGKPAGEALVNYSTGWTSFFVWTPIELSFRTGSSTTYELAINQYGNPPEPVWLDQVVIEKTGRRLAAPTPKDVERGFQLFSQSIMQPFDEQAAPAPDACVDAVRILLAKGEYEPGFIALRALRPLRDVDVRAGDLSGPGGATLSSDRIVIRQLRHSLLPISHPRFAAKDTNLAWWVTVNARGKIPAGVYTGALHVMVAGNAQATIPFTVEVLNLTLPKADIAFTMYHAEAYFPDASFLTERLRRAYYRDMREHGMNTVTVYNTPDVDGRRIDFSKNYKYPPDDPLRRHEFGLDRIVPMILESGLCTADQPIMWLVSKGGEYGFGGAGEAVTRAMLEEWLTRKWPTPLLYVSDEPSTRERIDAVKPVLKRIQSWKLPVKTVTAGLDMDELGSLYDVWILHGATYEARQKAAEDDAELWTYNCNVPYTNAPFPRALFGFCAYRTGVRGVAQWAYYDAKNWTMDADGTVHGSNTLSRVCLSAEGPVPTVAWEATREGIDDYRYAKLFDHLLRRTEEAITSCRKESAVILSEEDRSKIEARELRREHKFDPKAPQEDWHAVDEKQRAGEQWLLAARTLEREFRAAHRARDKVLQTIPFDAMAPSGALPFARSMAHYYPVLGLGDPATAAERKRRLLISYMLRLQAALAHIP